MSDFRSLVWLERIDANAVAACCSFHEIYKGAIYAAGTFVLLDRALHRGDWRRQAEEKLRDELRRGVHSTRFGGANRHGMPQVGRIRDLNRA